MEGFINSIHPFIWPAIIAAVISLGATYRLIEWALKRHLTPNIRERDVHKNPIPRLGGIAIALSFWMVVLVLALFLPNRLHFTDMRILGIDRNLFGVIVGAFIIIATMAYDDLKGLKWSWKLLAQFLAAFAVASFGITIHWFSKPYGSGLELSESLFHIGSIAITPGFIFVVLWIVLVMNVLNWLDGLDGLAGGIAVIAVSALFLLSISPRIDQPATALLSAVLIGSIMGFLPFNINPAKIFLGDTGSMFVGYMIAIIAIISGGKVATASLVLGLPIIDGLWVICSRLAQHKSPFIADRSHLHHRLMHIGLSTRQTVALLYLVTIFLGYVALGRGTEGKMWAGIWLLTVVLLFSFALIAVESYKKAKGSSK
jgi:UDP-GlcNAc:undecaprenyl-phosphate GlcNAc-1-phosphate transferase